jgi:hypothetical protein
MFQFSVNDSPRYVHPLKSYWINPICHMRRFPFSLHIRHPCLRNTVYPTSYVSPTNMKIEGFPTVYRHISDGNPSEDCTIFLGLVILGVLDVRILKEKAPELVAKLPVLGGQVIKTVPHLRGNSISQELEADSTCRRRLTLSPPAQRSTSNPGTFRRSSMIFSQSTFLHLLPQLGRLPTDLISRILPLTMTWFTLTLHSPRYPAIFSLYVLRPLIMQHY